MRCAFCGHDLGDARPASCPSCHAGLQGLTEGQMATITDELKNTDRASTLGVFFGTLSIGMAIISYLDQWGLFFVVGFSIIAVVLWVAAITKGLKAQGLKWMLTWWGKQGQSAKTEVEDRGAKEIDSIEAIRKLAELRDQGILTEEEFEQKKRKLL